MKIKKGDLVYVLEKFWMIDEACKQIYIPPGMRNTQEQELEVKVAHRNGDVTLSNNYRYIAKFVQKVNSEDYEFRKLLMKT